MTQLHWNLNGNLKRKRRSFEKYELNAIFWWTEEAMKGGQILFHSGSRWLFTSWSWWLLWLSFIVIIISWLSRFVNTLIRVFSNYFIDGIQSIHWTVRGSKCMQEWWIETNSLQFCHWHCIGRISELRESKKCNSLRGNEPHRASSRKKQMDNAAHNNTIFYNKLRQWRVERHNTRGRRNNY